MKPTDIIQDKINKLPKGYIFTYRDFIEEVNISFEALVKYLNRLADNNKISKLSKGKYYKPEKTIFGIVNPEPRQVVKDLLIENGNLIGYITGISVFSELGLTTQIGFEIQIGRNTPKAFLERKPYRISFLLQKNKITTDNIKYLQLLDALRLIKKIPDATIVNSSKILQRKLNDYSVDELQKIQRLALKYPPSTRALLGCLLEDNVETLILRNSLNPATKYQFNGIMKEFPNAINWNII
ncbi:type IV toxin-antitoxin system AbiEi family antitoxin domain-containing protein [Myroides sp. LJL115]